MEENSLQCSNAQINAIAEALRKELNDSYSSFSIEISRKKGEKIKIEHILLADSKGMGEKKPIRITGGLYDLFW